MCLKWQTKSDAVTVSLQEWTNRNKIPTFRERSDLRQVVKAQQADFGVSIWGFLKAYCRAKGSSDVNPKMGLMCFEHKKTGSPSFLIEAIRPACTEEGRSFVSNLIWPKEDPLVQDVRDHESWFISLSWQFGQIYVIAGQSQIVFTGKLSVKGRVSIGPCATHRNYVTNRCLGIDRQILYCNSRHKTSKQVQGLELQPRVKPCLGVKQA